MEICFKFDIDIFLKCDIFLLDLIFFKKWQHCFIDSGDLGLTVFLDSLNLEKKFFFGLFRKISNGLGCYLIDVVAGEVFVVLFLYDFDEFFFRPRKSPI